MWDDLRLVEQFGGHLDDGKDEKVRDVLVRSLLKIRVKKGGVHYLKLNRVQKEYSRTCGKRNIILKARQVGITTYLAARFFIQTITKPGTLTVQVAHTEESAQAIFNIVHRFWENLPNSRVRRGAVPWRRRGSSWSLLGVFGSRPRLVSQEFQGEPTAVR